MSLWLGALFPSLVILMYNIPASLVIIPDLCPLNDIKTHLNMYLQEEKETVYKIFTGVYI